MDTLYMPKIREISNEKLEDYLKAYKIKRRKEPKNKDWEQKVKAIEKALQERSLLGIHIKEKRPSIIITKLKSIFTKNKKPVKKAKTKKRKG